MEALHKAVRCSAMTHVLLTHRGRSFRERQMPLCEKGRSGPRSMKTPDSPASAPFISRAGHVPPVSILSRAPGIRDNSDYGLWRGAELHSVVQLDVLLITLQLTLDARSSPESHRL